MKYSMLTAALIFGLSGCVTKSQNESQEKIMSIQIIDRNGFNETMSSKDRLKLYQNVNFLQPQPYQKVTRLYRKNHEGKSLSKLTSYHPNGQLWQYLEVVNGRAYGLYKEWHPNGSAKLTAKVIEGVGDLSAEAQESWVFDGMTHAWSAEGKQLAEIFYEKGILSGETKYYRPDGTLWKTVPYFHGQVQGNVILYDRSGMQCGKMTYYQDRQHGATYFKGDKDFPPYTEEYQYGLLMNGTYRDFSGKVVSEIEKGIGKKPFYEKGKLTSIYSYLKGQVEGEVQIFAEDGSLKSTHTILNGQKHGEELIYFPSQSQVKLSISWYQDQIHGKYQTWYQNGQVESEKEMYKNKKHGTHLAWYQNGQLMLVEEYEHEKLIKGSYFKKGDKQTVSSVENGEGVATLYDSEGFLIKRVKYEQGEPIE